MQQECQQHKKKTAINQYHVPNIIRNMKSRALRWKLYVARMEDIKKKLILVEEPEGKRPLIRFPSNKDFDEGAKSPRFYF
jgi:hypothetical protein